MPTLLKVHPDGREEFKEGGSRCEAIRWKDDADNTLVIEGHEPIVGCSLLVGSVTARSYSSRDWWMTTTITKIIEETNEYILFETINSKYKLLR